MEIYLDRLFISRNHNSFEPKINNSILPHKFYHSMEKLEKTMTKANNLHIKDKKKNISIKKKENIDCIILNDYNISHIKHGLLTPFLKECFINIQYLSLKYNHIRSIHFIKHLPNLYYLDISDNPLEDIEILNTKNIFGYLKFSLERYSEKKILNIKGLYCGIFELYLNDESLLPIFINNNPFICLFNNKVNYFYDKVLSDEEKDSKQKRRYSFRAFRSLIQRNIIIEKKDNEKEKEELKEEFNEEVKNKEKNEYLKIKEEKNILTGKNNSNGENKEKNKEKFRRQNKRKSSLKLKYTYINCYNYGFKSKNSKEKEKKKAKEVINEVKNENLLKIKNFFDEYNDIIINICNNCNAGGRKSKIPVKAKYLKKYKDYLYIERRKLILLSDIYQKLSIFNKNKKENKCYVRNKEMLNVNPYIDGLEMFNLHKYIKYIYIEPNIAVIILIVLLFFCLGLISNLMMNALIGHLLVKYYKYIELINTPKFEIENTNFHFLSFYYVNYEDIKNKLNYLDIKNKKIVDIMKILEMTKITLKSNELFFNKKKIILYDINDINKNRYNEKICYLELLEIKEEILVLLIYLCDFIIYDDLEQILINKGYPNEYSYLIRFKEILKEKELNIKEEKMALSERKYQKYQMERLCNEFYFKLYKIEEIKNSKFNIKKNIITQLKNKKNDKEEEYIKTEDIENVNQYLVIQNKNIKLAKNKKIFKNEKIINSLKTFSKSINNNCYKNYILTDYFKLKNNKNINEVDLSNKIYSFKENKKKLNEIINSDKIHKYQDKTKLLRTFNNSNPKNKIKKFSSLKLLLKVKNLKNNKKKLYSSDDYIFKTFSNGFNNINNKLENNFYFKGNYSNRIKDIKYLNDLLSEKNKIMTIRNIDNFATLRNAKRIFNKNHKECFFSKNGINLTDKGEINNNNYFKSRNKIEINNSFPSLNIQKYNQKEMARILFNYKKNKNKKYRKKK